MAEYSRGSKVCGIYTITNIVNGKMYIGYTNDLYTRGKKHLSELRNKEHNNPYLQNSFNKYGEQNFKFEVLEECEERFLVSQEHYWVLLLRTKEEEFGYNIKETHPNSIGGRHSQETKNKISKINKGRKRPDNQLIWGGKKHSEETKAKISKAKLGVPTRHIMTEEHKIKFFEGRKEYWLNQPKKVKPVKSIKTEISWKHLPESIEKIRQRSQQEDNKIRIRKIQKIAAKKRIGTHHSYETKLNMNKKKFGSRIIEIYDLDNNFISSCNLISEAMEITGIKRTAINNNLSGWSNSTRTHIFKYKEV